MNSFTVDSASMAPSLVAPGEAVGSGPRRLVRSLGSHILAPVAYDQDLADRIRELLGTAPGITEQRMFGGLAFLVRGNMAVAASGQGGVMVRVDPAESERLVKTTTATPMIMKGRPMAGWLRVPTKDVRTKPQLRKWVTIGTTYAGSLPAKSPRGVPRATA
jgi:TfoX/Sxy family transcriptional regulator of competence genes